MISKGKDKWNLSSFKILIGILKGPEALDGFNCEISFSISKADTGER